jgi:PD-(D/E)XK nuclease superfamily
MIFSISEITTYMRCRRAWNYSSTNRMRLSKLIPGVALNLGTAVHAALDEWTFDPRVNPVEAYLRKLAYMLDEAVVLYAKNTGGGKPSDEELSPYYDAIKLGSAMMNNYVLFWKQPLPPGFSVIDPEQEVIVDVPGTPHKIKAKLDELIVDMHNQVFILERKTYAIRPLKGIIEYRPQFKCYMWAARKVIGPQVVGMAYDGLWKRDHVPKGKKLEDLFTRMLIRYNNHEIAEFEAFLTYITTEMASDPMIYPHWIEDSTSFLGCARCGFKTPCIAESRGEDTQYFERTQYYIRPEREAEDSEELEYA